MPSIRFSIDSAGADRGARQFTSAIDRVVADARRAAQAIEQMDRALGALGRNASGVNSSVARIAAGFNAIPRALNPASQQVNSLTAAMRNMSSAAALSFGPLSGLGSRFTAIGSLATRNSVALGGMISAATGVSAALVTSVRAAADFEQAMLRVAKVTNASTTELKAQSADILKLSSSLGIPATELAKIEESAARLGIRGSQNLATFAAEIAKLTRTTDLDAGPLADSLAQFLNLTKSAPGEITKVSSAITALGNNFAAGEGKILSMALELARGSTAFGVSSDKLLALAASLAAVGERNERSGTALSQVLTGITQAAANGGQQLEKYARLLGVTGEQFQQLAKQDVGEVFIRVLKALQSEGPGAISILQDLHLGSSRNFKVLLTQAQAIDEVSRALGIVRGQYASSTATDQEFARMNEALNRQLEIAGVQIENLGVQLGAQLIPALTSALVAVNDFLRSLQGIEAPANAVGASMQGVANDVVLAVHAFQALAPLLTLTGSLMAGLATFDLSALASAIASIPARFEEVRQATGTLAQDMERLRSGQPLRLFEGAARDAEDARAVSGAVGVLTNNLQNATHAPDALSAAMSTLSKSTHETTGAFDKNADAVAKALAGMDRDIAAKKALATQGQAAAKAQEEINKLVAAGVTVDGPARAAILAKAQALVGYEHQAKAAGKATKDATDAMKKMDEGLAGVIRSLEKDLKLQGLDESQKSVVELTEKIEDLRAKAVEGGVDEAAARAAANAALAEAIQGQQRLNAKKAEEVRGDTLRGLEREVELRRIEITQGKAAAETQRVINELKDKGVDVTDEYIAKIRKQQDAMVELEKTSVDSWKGIDDAFQQTLDGLINGTLQMEDVWRSFTLGLLKDFAESMGGVSGLLGKLVSGVQGLADGTGSAGSFIESLGGGTARFQDKLGNTNYGDVVGAAVQGGATAYSLFQATDDTKLEGLIAKGTESGVINASNAIGQVVGTIAGAVLSVYLGPLGGIVGAAVGSALAGLIAGSVNRETFLTGKYTGFVGFQQVFDPFHAWLTDLVLNLPTLGLAMRKGAEAVLDESETFKALQSKFGDLTVRSGGPRDVYRNNLTGSDTARARGWSEGQVDLTEGATAAIFGQIAEGEMAEDAGRLGEAMGRIMAEFLSRGMDEGIDFEPMFDKLREFAHEAGIDLFSSMRALDDVMQQSMAAATTWGHLDPMAAATQGARAYAEALVGTTAVFEGDFPAGVNLTAIALRNMEKDGVNAFANLDDQAKDTLLNLTTDTELTMEIVQKLVEQGFTIDVEQFESQVQAIAGSAAFIGQNIGEVFSGPSVFAGIEALGQKLREAISGDVLSTATEQLFDKTRIAESFAPVYEVLGKLKEGDFDLTDAVGADSFKNQMVLAIANGKATLQEYIPQLRAIRDVAEEVDKAIEEALKPTAEEAFWQNLSETFEANKDAIEGMAAGMFDVAVQAERAGAGLGQQATREAMSAQIDQGIYTATKDAVSTHAGESPEAQRLAALTTEFQAKVKAAMEGGITQAELADLTALKAKMYEAGEQVADGIAASTKDLDALFRVDRLKENIEAATASLKDSVGAAAGSMFDVIKEGGSTAEGVKAFGESFRSSVRDNVLQGMQEALVQSVMMEGALAGLMGSLKQAVSVALEDGVISADEQVFIDNIAKGIGTATDATLNALEPTLNALGQTAQVVAGNTEKAQANVEDLDRSGREATYGVDEMARRAAKNLEDVGDAVPPATVQGIADGVGSLKDALGTEGGAAAQIGAGVGALKNALGDAEGGPASQIAAGVGALKNAIGGADNGPASDIASGLGTMKDALADGVISPIEAGILKLQGAVGSTGVTDDIAAGMNALAGAVGASTSGVPDDIKAGLTALHDAVGTPTNGPAAGISAGLGALKDAIGTDTSGTAADIGAGLGLLRGAFGVEESGSGLSAAVSGAIDAFGSPGNGVVGAADAVRDALNGANGAASAADTIASKLRDDLAPAADDLTSALQDGFKIGLGEAETAARNLATALGSIGGIPGRANGGPVPAGTMAFVGERGPELILAHAGGGVSVVPLDNVPGYANGTGDYVGISPRNTGPFGHPRIPPTPREHVWNNPDNDPNAPASETTISVSFNFDNAMDAYFAGGTSEDLHDALMKSTGQGIIDGLKQGLLAKIGMDQFQEDIAKAIERGASPEELIKMGTDFATKAQAGIEAAAPAYRAVAEAFGVELGESTKDAIEQIELDPALFAAATAALGGEFKVITDGVAQDLADALTAAAQAAAPKIGEMAGGSLRGLLSDPTKLNFATFAQSLRGEIYQNVAGGLIDAFIQSAVIQGALAPMLGAIQLIFDQIGKKQLSVAEANGMIAQQIALINSVLDDPAFKKTMETLITGIADIGKNLDAFPPAARDAAQSATDVQDAVSAAQQDVCDGTCGLKQETVDLGQTVLDASGRVADIQDIVWKAVAQDGGAPGTTGAPIPDTTNGGNGTYGTADWDAYRRRVARGHDSEFQAFAAGGIVTRPTLGLIGEAGPEMIIPLDALRDFVGANVDGSVIRELEAAQGAFDRIVAGKDSAVADAVAALSAAMREQSSFGLSSSATDDLLEARREFFDAQFASISEALSDVRPDVSAPVSTGTDDASESDESDDVTAAVDELRADLVRTLQQENRALRDAIASQPIVVNGEFKVGEDKAIDVLLKLKRTAHASGVNLFGVR